MTQLFTMDRYLLRTKFWRIFGGAFYFEDLEGNIVAYSRQKRFKLREDIVLYTFDFEDEFDKEGYKGKRNIRAFFFWGLAAS